MVIDNDTVNGFLFYHSCSKLSRWWKFVGPTARAFGKESAGNGSPTDYSDPLPGHG